jgi:PKHD-type hydroxylase
MKEIRITTEDFFIGNFGIPAPTDEIIEACTQNLSVDEKGISKRDEEAGVGDGETPDYKIRECYVSWLDVKNINFIEHGYRKVIENVNDMIWKMDLDHKWESDLQYTKYIGKGHHYDWHRDHYDEEVYPGHSGNNRKLSMVYCLSYKKDYTGGEFQIKTSKGSTYTRKFDYGDFIVFPSKILHRVKPLKSGTRTTLVGWYR